MAAADQAFNGILATAHDIADLTGPAVLKHFRKAIPIDNKDAGGGFDPVTKADRAAEKIVRRVLADRYPDHGIVGEEFGSSIGASPYSWVIDPIDGTRAFIMGSPLWGTLIGVLKDGAPYAGLLDIPMTRERLWTARSGTMMSVAGGVPKRIKTRACATLSDAILTSTHPDLFEGAKRQRTLNALKGAVRMTRYGGDCYNYGLLAAGFVDLVVESGLKAYDIVALIPIIERAGGRVTTWQGKPATEGGDIIASGDARVHEAALALMARV